MTANAARSIFVSAQDGLKLHVRSWGARSSAALPVMCLPGLARNASDFEALASALAGDAKAPRPDIDQEPFTPASIHEQDTIKRRTEGR